MLIFVGTTTRPQLRNIAKELIFRDKGTFYFGDHKEKSRIWGKKPHVFFYNLMQKKQGWVSLDSIPKTKIILILFCKFNIFLASSPASEIIENQI